MKGVFAMSIKYKVRMITSTFGGAEKKTKVIAGNVRQKPVSFDEIAKVVSERSSASSADVKSVLDSLVWISMFFLRMGLRISLGELGTLGLQVRSKAVEDLKSFTPECLKTPRIRFIPSRTLKETVKGISYQRADGEAKMKAVVKPKGEADPAYHLPESGAAASEGHGDSSSVEPHSEEHPEGSI